MSRVPVVSVVDGCTRLVSDNRRCGALILTVRADGQRVCLCGHGVYPDPLAPNVARRFIEPHNRAVAHIPTRRRR